MPEHKTNAEYWDMECTFLISPDGTLDNLHIITLPMVVMSSGLPRGRWLRCSPDAPWERVNALRAWLFEHQLCGEGEMVRVTK